MRRFRNNPFTIFDPLERRLAPLQRYEGKAWGIEIDPTTTDRASIAVMKPKSRRLVVFAVCVSLVASVFVVRLVSLQVVQGATLRTAAEENRLRLKPLSAPRGIIYDRDGEPLVRNVPRLTLEVVPGDLPDEVGRAASAQLLSELLGEDEGALRAELDTTANQRYFSSRPFRTSVTYDQARMVQLHAEELAGIQVVDTATREYLGGPAFSHLLGYSGKISEEEYATLSERGYVLTDDVGKTGLEYTYEEALRGVSGRKQVEVDAVGREQRIVASEDPILGTNVWLSIDADLQQYAYDRLMAMIDQRQSTGGALVALDPRNGEVLALVTAPAYDNNLFTQKPDTTAYSALLSDPRRPLFQRAIAGQYPSGSTIKPSIAAAALQEGIIDERTTVQSTGGIHIDRWFFPDWKAGGHGTTDVRKAIAESVNTFFYTIGGGTDTFTGLGVQRMTDYLHGFGFGVRTGIDLDGEQDGFLPSREWKESVKGEPWYIGDTYHLAIGQGDLLVTPLQLANATAAIANGGAVYQPRVVTTLLDADEHREERHTTLAHTTGIAPRALAIVREGMRQAVEVGSARSLLTLPVPTAGKTGTAQFGSEGKTHSWFTAFAPYDHPEISIAVVIEGAGDGTEAALPVAKDVLAWYYGQR